MLHYIQQVLQQEAYPAVRPPVDAQISAIPGAIAPKVGEDLSQMWPNQCAKFHAHREALAEKSITAQTHF